ncbi:MAG: c-type cytochrome [Spirosomataceae bacterium]
MKRLFVPIGILILLASCGGGDQKTSESTTSTPAQETPTATADDDEKGIGPIKEVTLGHPLDQAMITAGKGIYDLKCGSCHRLTAEKLVGPGWQGVTKRRKPEWIMNFATNVEEMLNKDPKAQAMLEECLVRMPNQNLTEKDARSVLEFMRKNDGEN